MATVEKAHPEHRGERNPLRTHPVKKEKFRPKEFRDAQKPKDGKELKKSIQQANTVTDGEDG